MVLYRRLFKTHTQRLTVDRTTKEKALHFIAANGLKKTVLSCSFHALRDHTHAEIAGQAQNRSRDSARLLVIWRPGDEGAVGFDKVN